MSNKFNLAVSLIGVVAGLSTACASASEIRAAILKEYEAIVGQAFSADSGKQFWYQDNNGRSCTTCHTESLLAKGRHERTGKIIEPMAPSVNPERLTKRKKINKWFLRNCKWTIGRECTIQEKGDILLWLSEQ
ncbi:MAG TPA: DUF1924 domain-containing protein [Pseudomonadales bacterium]|jgi:hypothetical protein|nr:DUF1924 domain-containing protein [Pseudomonadales bacterium]MDP7450976.1 DUF1924 domain-containing protein [Arenicellales bacterium]MDP7315307.1 DUF1924 domain-containing protein [Pseudomonadales bacterium]MDP7576745.1 DUF1924 domain-containing protein [Pseudomonadales bacterium]HJL62186.1 DUF1924 domain-containing protein [Pseudomonadales bacterium]|tara:strand:+ start:90 stop:488 length:399 start_codon:yes stop_codon:yes gene_type:complete